MNSLKISIAASVVLLVLGTMIILKNSQQLATAQAKKHQLTTELTNSGFSIGKSHSKNGVRLIKHLSVDKEESAIRTNSPSPLADVMLKITNTIKCDLQSDPKTENPIAELKKNFNNLELEDWRILFSQLRTKQDFDKTGYNNTILDEMISILYQRSVAPEDSWLLQLASEFPEIFQNNTSGINSINNCIFGLLEKDSDAAIEWVRQNHLKFPGFVQDHGFACGFISSLATKNPTRALELISELEIKNVAYAISVSALDQKSNEQRTSFLNALRKNNFLLSENQTREGMIDRFKVSLARSALEQGFDTSIQWLSIAENQPDDWNNLIDNIGDHTKFTNYEKWAEWLEKNLPPKSVDSGIRELISNWTRKDYREAGEWLVKTREGPTKNAAIRAYAETIAAYEPTTAVQWAEKLPLGETRDQTLQTIYHKWPETDSGSKEAFGKSLGLE